MDGQNTSMEVLDPVRPSDGVTVPDIHITPSPIRLTSEEKSEIEQFFGVHAVRFEQLEHLERLGIHLRELDIRELTKTTMFLNQQALLPVVQKISELALEGDGKLAPELAKALGYLSEKLSKAGTATKIVSEKTPQTANPNQGRTKSFLPGEDVRPPIALQVNHYHGVKPA